MRNSTLMIIAGLCLATGCAPVGSLPGDHVGGNSPQGQPAPMPQPAPPPMHSPPPAPAPGPAPAPAPTARPSTDPNLTTCPGKNMVEGTDVGSYDNGSSWTKFRTAGNAFAMIKATEGVSFVNPLFTIDWTSTKAAGVLHGAYHFFHPGDDPISSANAFLKVMGILDQDDLPPILDWEVTDGLSNSKQIANAKVWLNAVEAATGRRPMLYTGVSFWNALGNPQGFEKYPLYLAEYKVTCPKVPPPWSTFAIWQDSETATIPGLSQVGHSDTDIFNGTLSDLLGL